MASRAPEQVGGDPPREVDLQCLARDANEGILMERHQIGEIEASAMLRDHSRRSGRKLVDVAEAVLAGHLLLTPSSGSARGGGR